VGWLPAPMVQRIVEEQKAEIERRIRVLRGGGPLPPIEDRTVILVDDGIAMGSTMQASIELCKHQNAGRIVVGVPVAGQRVRDKVAKRVDEVVVLETPVFFRAVAQVYRDWYDVSDDQVLKIMTRWREERTG
jgi:putative phosphoribosyl transferase